LGDALIASRTLYVWFRAVVRVAGIDMMLVRVGGVGAGCSGGEERNWCLLLVIEVGHNRRI
jgi:hypothetical protein